MKLGQYNTACAITSPLTLSVAASTAESKSAALRGAAAFDFAARSLS